MKAEAAPYYSRLFRRHLCDMHIADYDPIFLSELSPREYVNNLLTARVQLAMVYLQSHTGLCNWQTKSGKVHRAFADGSDKLHELIRLCKENGISTVGYYSLQFNTAEHDAHPDRRMVDESGKSKLEQSPDYRYGLCCPNNPDYRRFVFTQIREMVAEFPVDGMFYDMLYWPHFCHCEACRGLWRERYGTPLPTGEEDGQWRVYLRERERQLGEWAQAVTDYTKALKPHLSVEHNLSAACSASPYLGCTESVNLACDYTGGDLYGDVFTHSFVCKLYRGLSRNAPFEYMTGRCTPDLKAHTVTKSEEELTQSVMLTAAHHGATLLIDAMDPVGTLDSRVYRLMGRVFDKQIPLEPYFYGVPVADVALLYSMTAKENLQKQNGQRQFLSFEGTRQGFSNHDCVLASLRTLIGAHIPVDVANVSNLSAVCGRTRVLVLSNLNQTSSETVEQILSYVREGGCVYMSNCDEEALFTELTGGRLTGYTPHTCTYVAPTAGNEGLLPDYNGKYPLSVDCSVPLIEGIAAEKILATVTLPYTAPGEGRFASIHSNPPGIATDYPAIFLTEYGKGRVIFCGAPVELFPYPAHKQLFLKLIGLLSGGDYAFSADAPRKVELLMYRAEGQLLIHAVNLSQEEDIETVRPFRIRVRGERVKAIYSLPDRSEIPFAREGNGTVFVCEGLHFTSWFLLETE